MMRVCYVIPSLEIAGTERQLLYLLQGLARDCDLTVACTNRAGALAGEARRAGARVMELGVCSGWDPSAWWKLRRVFEAHRPDVVHSFLFGFDLYANLAARQTGVPVVISSRRQLATWKKRRHLFIQRRANQWVDCVVANSRAVAEFAIAQERADPRLFRIIPNGIAPDLFIRRADPHGLRPRYNIPPCSRVIGIVANFSPVKDHGLFVRMAGELRRRRADVHFLMVGIGPLVQSVESNLRARGLSDCFTRVASIADIADLYALMDVSVLCSKAEGFPNAILESMAASRPVVAAAVGGIPELIADGDTGRLIASRDPGAFADAVEWVLDHPEESRAMAARGASFVQDHFSVERMVEGYRALYAEFLEQTRWKDR
ncbi:MAG TPA: glycosyltransferase [Candidatus Hydrogenedentes bacterium]|nr:glycosyltransferase [Candidatus Hydrogenedentota bacterium]